MRYLILCLLSFGLILFSCRKEDIASPSFINIPEFSTTVKINQGSDHQPFPYLNIFIDENSVGVVQAPSTLATIKKGAVNLDIFPVIRQFAREGTTTYSVMKPFSLSTTLKENETDTIRPVFEYHDNAEFPWLEDFNDNFASLQLKTGTIDTFYIENDPDISLDGSNYMHIPMGAGESYFEIESADLFNLPVDGRDVYMEIDYRCNVAFTIGVYATSSTEVIALPSVSPYDTEGEWRKAYIYLSDETRNRTLDTRFRVFVRAVNAEVADPHIYFENIKLVYRKG